MQNYLAERGITSSVSSEFQLGYVDSPAAREHEGFHGWLSIPYLMADGDPVGMKFRRPPGIEGKPKYLTHPGMGQRLYNAPALLLDSGVVAVTEGELDAVVMQSAVGAPSVAVPGVNSFRDDWVYLFEGYDRILVLGDGDGPGEQFADEVARKLPNATPVPMPQGYDVSTFTVEHGASALRERAGLCEV